MSSWLKLWRGACQPLETPPQPTNALRLYRGAVEPQVAFASMAAKITGDATDCTDVPLTGIGGISVGLYLQTQSGVTILLQLGGFLELQESPPPSAIAREVGIFGGVPLTGVVNQ